MITNALGILNCKNIDSGNNSETILFYNLNIKCYDKKYYAWIFLYSVPIVTFLLFYSIKLFKTVKKAANSLK